LCGWTFGQIAVRQRSVAQRDGGRRNDERNSKCERCNQFERNGVVPAKSFFQFRWCETGMAGQLCHDRIPGESILAEASAAMPAPVRPELGAAIEE